ncbi:caspase domain-containing protein [Epithele typhae]|uniref:caspase domain-containing protein n=1 Tax=Epithele typhae TaxID=378194 RepID=UPI0020084518|nr:caspase domain-containing protein [Epithele typhae]KAH9913686.1 caspase domain-containing protein [Epithele typhae]
MMWDLSGGASPPQYPQQQQSRAISMPSRTLQGEVSFPAPARSSLMCALTFFSPGGFAVSAPPFAQPFMPIGAAGDFAPGYAPSTYAPSSHRSFVDGAGPWASTRSDHTSMPRGPTVERAVHIRTSRRHSHSQVVHVHSSGHSPRPPHVTVTHVARPAQVPHASSSSKPHKISRPQQLQPLSSSGEGRHHLFQYSKCTGHRKALCARHIGINYKGQENELLGCVNDAKNVRRFLSHRGYKKEDIVILTDDSPNPREQPTRANMLDAMRWLVKGACCNDSLFFHYSGHGSQVQDRNGDEIDGMDEGECGLSLIFPVDYKQAGHISDDLLHAVMVKKLPTGCRLTALFDSCHSGSVLDLPYLYSTDGRTKGSQVTAKWFDYKSTPADVISWSGCKDSQTSADTYENGVATGAMSHAFISSMRDSPNQTYQELLRSVREILKRKYSQLPQLSSSHRIDTNLKFIF